MKRDFLRGFELADEVVDAIMSENGRDIERTKSQAAANFSAACTQLEEWKCRADALETQLGEIQANSEKQQFDSALDNRLKTAKARNIKAVRALLDMDMLTFEGREISGLDQQIECIKADCAYLFDSDKCDVSTPDAPRFEVVDRSNGRVQAMDSRVRAAMGLADR